MPCLLRNGLSALALLVTVGVPRLASAVASGEIYTTESYGYGKFEARLSFAGGDGVVGSFFLWKDGSEISGMFWNELDFEKVGANCLVKSNALYGNPGANHSKDHQVADACSGYHVYAYEWTPDAIVWRVDGMEIRRETGDAATAFAQNASAMQVRFNVWPGDATFGGNFNPSILPVHQYVDWVQYSAYENGDFTLKWREDFDGETLPTGWATATWESPKNLSTHDPRNVNLLGGHLVISLTADDATGPAGAMPGPGDGSGAGGMGSGGSGGGDPGGSGGSGAEASGGAAGSTGAAPGGGTAGTGEPMPGTGGGAAGGEPGAGGAPSAGGPSSGGMPGTAGGTASGGTGVNGSGATGPGSGGTGTTPGTGGAPGTAGTPGSPEAGASSSKDASDDGGCSVKSSRKSRSGALLGVLGAVLFGALGRRARRRRVT